ncbi:MAG: hypothetical protein JNJ43_16455 [Anaerolineales bacterium]|nr:hypothetical protein [Anaerolineales bacterium]
MKIISERLLLYPKLFTLKYSLTIFAIGLFFIFPMQLFIWSMIVSPLLNFILMMIIVILGLLWKFITFAILIMAALHSISSFIIKSPNKLISLCVSITLFISFLFVDPEPNFRTGHPALLIGARTRLLWSGGAENVKKDALELLNQETDENGNIISDSWSSSINMLGATTIKVDKTSQIVAIFIHGNLHYDFDNFGYLFTFNDEPNIDFLKVEEMGVIIHYWKLGEGVYFFDREW